MPTPIPSPTVKSNDRSDDELKGTLFGFAFGDLNVWDYARLMYGGLLGQGNLYWPLINGGLS